jgi:hypothetical protein
VLRAPLQSLRLRQDSRSRGTALVGLSKPEVVVTISTIFTACRLPPLRVLGRSLASLPRRDFGVISHPGSSALLHPKSPANVPRGSAHVDPHGFELPFRALLSPRLVDQPPLVGFANSARSPARSLPAAPPPTHPPCIHSR